MGSSKHLNYGLDKSEFQPDLSRFNWDYIKGLIDTDGSIRKNPEIKGFSIAISQAHPIFLEKLKHWIEYNFSVIGKTYMEGNQIAFCDKDFYNFIINYKPKNLDSYYAGIIDGDGSFCSHKSSSGIYWRFCLGASKERKIKIFMEFFEFYNLKPTVWENKNTRCKMFGIQKVNDLISLLDKIGDRLIIKKFVGDKIKKELAERKVALKQKCIFCGEEFERKLNKGHNLKFICDREECRKRKNRERQRKYRIKDKQNKEGIRGEVN